VYDACALDELVSNLADAQEDVRPPVDLEVGDADGLGDEDVGGRCVTGTAEALEALGRDAGAGELLFEVIPEMVRANLRDHAGASPKFGDVDGDVGRLAAEVADELSGGPKRNRELVRDEVHERLLDGEHVEGLSSEPGASIAPLAPLLPGTCSGQYSKLPRRTPQEVARRAHPGIRPRPHRARGGAPLLAAPGSGAGKLRGGTLYPRYFSCGGRPWKPREGARRWAGSGGLTP
jgi:hypothetical protein